MSKLVIEHKRDNAVKEFKDTALQFAAVVNDGSVLKCVRSRQWISKMAWAYDRLVAFQLALDEIIDDPKSNEIKRLQVQ